MCCEGKHIVGRGADTEVVATVERKLEDKLWFDQGHLFDQGGQSEP